MSESERIRVFPKPSATRTSGPVVTFDPASDGLAKSIAKAAGVSKSLTPAEAMHAEHGRLLKAFRESEGRDPNPNGDPAFWDAYRTILKSRTGSSQQG